MYSDAADPGHVWPIVRLQLADDEIVAKIHQADAGDARPVQSLPSQPGDGLSRHLLPTAVRYHYIRGDTIQEGVSIQQAGRSFLLQRDSPIRQVNPASSGAISAQVKRCISSLVSPCFQGQAEDDACRRVPLVCQKANHGRFVRSIESYLSHMRLLTAGSESVIIVIHTNESFFSGAPRQERHPVRCDGSPPQTRLLFPAFPALLYALFAAILCVMYWLRTFTGLLSSHPHA